MTETNFFTLTEDMHIHSTFSDGLHSPQENIEQATAIGLQRICCVDHVRTDTTWLPAYVRELERLREQATIEVQLGVEAKILNQQGDLDMPADLTGIDLIYAADHQFPLGNRAYTPKEIQAMLAQAQVSHLQLLDALVLSTVNVLRTHQNIVLAHLFSILPKVGMSEAQVPDEMVALIAHTARDTGAQIEIDERWKCPSPRTLKHFLDVGVPVRCSTDSHRKEKIGQYVYTRELLEYFQNATKTSSVSAAEQ